MSEKLSGLELLRKPFEKHHISKLPKPTKKQTDDVKADYKNGIRCTLCGGWHHKDVVHLDYVGHAALTDRLLDCDPSWDWTPMSFNTDGSPKLDANGGMWIKLTVCNVSRLGYGHPDGKSGGDAIKETIGDALRNAAMRFGAALDLWHKGDLHASEENETDESKKPIVNTAAAIDGHNSEKKHITEKVADLKKENQSNQNVDLANYVVQCGKKYAGMKLSDMKDFEIAGYLKYLDEGVSKNGKPLSGAFLEFHENATAYLNSLPKVDESDSMNF